MKVAIIDADLIGRKQHRFPNLACEKSDSGKRTQAVEIIYNCVGAIPDLHRKKPLKLREKQ